MAKLEDLKKGASVSGVIADDAVTVVDVTWHGSDVVDLTYRVADGSVGSVLIFRDKEPDLEVVKAGDACPAHYVPVPAQTTERNG